MPGRMSSDSGAPTDRPRHPTVPMGHGTGGEMPHRAFAALSIAVLAVMALRFPCNGSANSVSPTRPSHSPPTSIPQHHLDHAAAHRKMHPGGSHLFFPNGV